MHATYRNVTALASGIIALFFILSGAPPALPRLGLASAAQSGVAPGALGSGAKPSWRGDTANSGHDTASGPATTPSQVFNVKAGFTGAINGLELGSDNSLYFALQGGIVFSYQPSGTKKWQFPSSGTLGTYGGLDPSNPGSSPTLSSDGFVYIGNDNGNVYQIDSTAGSGTSILSSGSGSAFAQSPQIAPDNSLYIGDTGSTFYHVQPGSGTGTILSSVAAPGSTQVPTLLNGQPNPYYVPGGNNHSVAPYKFEGQTALGPNGSAYAAYAATSDGNPNGTPRIGTLYKITDNPASSSTATIVWAQPLVGEPTAPLYAANPVTPSVPLIIVADKFPEVLAVRADTGAPVWQFVPANSTAPFYASPALSPDGTTLYVANGGDSLYALSVATGQLVGTFGSNGIVSLSSGAQSAPIVDAQGNIFVQDGSGTLHAITAGGSSLWTVSGLGSSKFMSPAIAPSNTIYVGNALATVRGYQGAPPPSSTPTGTPGGPTYTPTNTPTDTPTDTPGPPTNTPTHTVVPPTNTPLPPTHTPTNTPMTAPTKTPTPTSTPTNPAGQPTNTPTSTPPPTSTPTNTPPTSTPTSTPVLPTSTATNTPVPPTNTSAPPTTTPLPPTSTATTATATPTSTATAPVASPTGTATAGVPAPTSTATATDTPVPPTPTCRVTLTVHNHTALASGQTLVITIVTATHAHVEGALRVGHHTLATFHGSANAHGQFTTHLRVSSATSAKALLSVTARTGCGTATRTAHIAITAPSAGITLPLAVALARLSVASGDTVTLRLRTAPRMRVVVGLRVLATSTVTHKVGKHHTRIVHVTVVYSRTFRGSADRHGSYTLRVRLTLKAPRHATLRLALTARTARGATIRSGTVTLQHTP